MSPPINPNHQTLPKETTIQTSHTMVWLCLSFMETVFFRVLILSMLCGDIYPCHEIDQELVCFHSGVTFCCVTTSPFTYIRSSPGAHWNGFHFGAPMNVAVRNSIVCIFCTNAHGILLELWDLGVCICLSVAHVGCIPKWVDQFLPPPLDENSNCFVSAPILAIFCMFSF